jgi:hypothetical protein
MEYVKQGMNRRVGVEESLLAKNKNKVAALFELLERWETEECWGMFSFVRHMRHGRSSAFACLGAMGRKEMERREGLGLFGWKRRRI